MFDNNSLVRAQDDNFKIGPYLTVQNALKMALNKMHIIPPFLKKRIDMPKV